MDKIILSAYSGLTAASLGLCILSLTILASCVAERSFNGRFTCALGLSLWSGFQFIDRLWWTSWKSNYISRQPSAWMYDHWMSLIGPILMTSGILLVMLYFTKNSPYWRFFWVNLSVICGAALLTYQVK